LLLALLLRGLDEMAECGHDAPVLWRSLRDVAPVSAAFTDAGHAGLSYPQHRELRSWPAFELVDDVKAAQTTPSHGELAAHITDALGGQVEAVAVGGTGVAAALWTKESFPPWYRVVIWSGRQPWPVTPRQVRIWGDPCWSLTGELAVTAFDGIRRGIVRIDPADATTR
jgi:hypothetical protein